MPIVKPIAGHTRCANVMRYLTRKDRALACDYLNIDAPTVGYEDSLPVYGDVDWAAVMDSTRHHHGNDEPWRGRRVRTYVHYVVSPDPKDAIALPALREALEAGFLPERAARPLASGREAPPARPGARRETSWRQQAGFARQAGRPQWPQPPDGCDGGRGR